MWDLSWQGPWFPWENNIEQNMWEGIGDKNSKKNMMDGWE